MNCETCGLPEEPINGGEFCTARFLRSSTEEIACLRRALASRDGEIAALRSVGAAWAGEMVEEVRRLTIDRDEAKWEHACEVGYRARIKGAKRSDAPIEDSEFWEIGWYRADFFEAACTLLCVDDICWFENVPGEQERHRHGDENDAIKALEELIAEHKDQTAEVTRLESLLAIERGRVEGMQEGAETLKTELANAHLDVEAWRGTCATNEGTIERLTSERADLRARLNAAEERLLDAGEAVDASRATIIDVRTILGGNATNCETKDIVELAEDVARRLTAAETAKVAAQESARVADRAGLHWFDEHGRIACELATAKGDAGRVRKELADELWERANRLLDAGGGCGSGADTERRIYELAREVMHEVADDFAALSPPTGHAAGETLLDEIAKERKRQEAKWGEQNSHFRLGDWMSCLGNIALKARAKSDLPGETRRELVKLAALVMRASDANGGHAAGEVAACPSTCASFQMEGGYALKCDCPAPVDEKGKAL